MNIKKISFIAFSVLFLCNSYLLFASKKVKEPKMSIEERQFWEKAPRARGKVVEVYKKGEYKGACLVKLDNKVNNVQHVGCDVKNAKIRPGSVIAVKVALPPGLGIRSKIIRVITY